VSISGTRTWVAGFLRYMQINTINYFGVVANVGANWQFRVQGTNLSNEIGLTEGNARVAGNPTGPGGILLARSIEGREINFQVKFNF
jgi:hypothetical protein